METNGLGGFYDDNQNIENASPEKQVLYYKKRLEENQAEFDEYQQSSRELENELETQLANNEKRIRDLEAKNRQLLNENELLRTRFERISTESRTQLNDLQGKYESVSAENEQLKSYIRDLEQSNDDLDRAKRTLDATLAEFDTKLNEQIERNELLESEIGEKEQLQVVIQRLKDEARDLRLELMIQQSSKNKKSGLGESESNNTSPTSTRPPKIATSVHNSSNHNHSANLTNGSATPDSKAAHQPSSPSYNTPKQSPNQIPLLSASSRISALNIVSDLLRKVGALESKLASCRSIVPVSASLMNSTKTTSPGSIKGGSATNNVDTTNSPVNASPLKDINANV